MKDESLAILLVAASPAAVTSAIAADENILGTQFASEGEGRTKLKRRALEETRADLEKKIADLENTKASTDPKAHRENIQQQTCGTHWEPTSKT